MLYKKFWFIVSTRDAKTSSTSAEVTVVKIENERKCRSKEWRQAPAPGKNKTSKEAKTLEGRKECDIYA
jgi:hypothetical protein